VEAILYRVLVTDHFAFFPLYIIDLAETVYIPLATYCVHISLNINGVLLAIQRYDANYESDLTRNRQNKQDSRHATNIDDTFLILIKI